MGNYCCYYMFEDCPIEDAPELPATIVGNYAYQYMFKNCQHLINGPKIAATSFGTNACQNMFLDCKILRRLEVNFSTWASGCTTNWLSGVNTNDGVFICPSALNTTTRDASHILSGWTIVTK